MVKLLQLLSSNCFLRAILNLKHYSDRISDRPSGSFYGINILTFLSGIPSGIYIYIHVIIIIILFVFYYYYFFIIFIFIIVIFIYLAFYLASILTYFLACCLTFYSRILFCMFSGIHFGFFFCHLFWHSPWHSFWHFFWHSIWHSLWRLAGVRQCPLRSGARGWGQRGEEEEKRRRGGGESLWYNLGTLTWQVGQNQIIQTCRIFFLILTSRNCFLQIRKHSFAAGRFPNARLGYPRVDHAVQIQSPPQRPGTYFSFPQHPDHTACGSRKQERSWCRRRNGTAAPVGYKHAHARTHTQTHTHRHMMTH